MMVAIVLVGLCALIVCWRWLKFGPSNDCLCPFCESERFKRDHMDKNS